VRGRLVWFIQLNTSVIYLALLWMLGEREISVFVYRNKQVGAKTQWVRYIAVHY